MGLTRLRAEQISDIDYKQAVRVITVTNVTLSGGAPSQVDSVNLSAGDRVLVNGQSTGSQNGIYEVQTVGTGSNGTWVRSTDTNATGELEAGTIVMVTEGTVYKDTQWKLTTNNPIIIGTTALTFEQNSAFAFGNVYANGTAVLANTVGDVLTLTAGNNIQITGNNSAKSVTIAVTGVSTANISNGTSNVTVVSSGGNVTVGVGGTANVAEFSTTGLRIIGLASASGNVTGANLSTAGLITATGNILGGNILTAGLISATSTITSSANIIGGNILTAGIMSSTGNGIHGNILTAGLISATGNLFAGNALLSGNLTVNGNVTYINSNVVTINDLAINLANNAATAAAADGGGIEVGPAGSPYITWLYNNAANTFTSSAGISAVGNISGANLRTAGLITATGNVTGGNILTGGLISATSTITSATNIIGGNLTTAGLITATGNVTGGNILTGGLISATSTITSAANIIGGNISTAGLITATGNIQGGNLLTAGLISATSTITSAANITGGNISTAGLITATGNITGGNILTVGQVSATGNVTGNFFIGNGAFLTGLSAGSSNGISNGATSISIPVASGNITFSVAGQSNTVVVNLGSFTMYGTFAGPRTLAANVAVANAVNAVIFGPVTIADGYNITVPDASTLYTYSGA